MTRMRTELRAGSSGEVRGAEVRSRAVRGKTTDTAHDGSDPLHSVSLR